MTTRTTFPTTVHWQDMFDDVTINDLQSVKYRVEEEHFPLSKTNLDGETVAHIAAKKGYLVMLQYFLRREPGLLEVKDSWDQTVLALAIKKGATHMVRYLVEDLWADIYHPRHQRFGDMAIHIAAAEGQLEILKYFVEERNVDVNTLNFLKEPPIFSAAEKPRLSTLRYLVEKKNANVTILDRNNDNILFISAKKGDLKVPKYLLDERKIPFDINWQDIFGRTLVHMASRFDQLDFIKYCVEEKGANIHLTTNRGWTPLFEAAVAGSPNAFKYLREKGADINHKDEANQTLEQLADEVIIKLLNETRHERSRRDLRPIHLPTSFLTDESHEKILQSATWEVARESESSFGSTSLPFVGFGASKIQNFLAVANTLIGYVSKNSFCRKHHEALQSPKDLIHARINRMAFEALEQISNHYD